MKRTARLKITATEAESWEEAFIKYFRKIELRVRYGMIMVTPAVEIKKLAMEKVLKELEALDE